jgi:Rhodopirellula transposase DDE domain
VEQGRAPLVFLYLLRLAGEPLRDYETIVNLIAETTTAKGLTVTCRLGRRQYPTGRKVTAEEMKCVNLYPEKFHGEWNYVIKPSPARQRSTK